LLTVAVVMLSLTILTFNSAVNVQVQKNGPLMSWILIRVSRLTGNAWIGLKKMDIQTKNAFYATKNKYINKSKVEY